MTDVPSSARTLIARQAGAISNAQLEVLGVPRCVPARLVKRGHWSRLARGIFSTGEPTWGTYAWAGLLQCPSGGVLGGEAAAHLWGWRDQPDLIEVWSQCRVPSSARWRFRRGVRLSRGCPDRTTREETVLDLWSQLSAREGEALVSNAVSSGLRISALRSAMETRARLARRQELLELLGDVGAGAHSVLERLYLRDVERGHGLPSATRQARRGHRRTDCEYEGYGLIVELDGRLGHAGEGAFRDMRRDNEHLLMGLSTLRFGYADVKRFPCDVAAQVAAVLQARGWAGELSACPACGR